MIYNFKTSTLAAITAAATLLGSGQASALGYPNPSTPQTINLIGTPVANCIGKNDNGVGASNTAFVIRLFN